MTFDSGYSCSDPPSQLANKKGGRKREREAAGGGGLWAIQSSKCSKVVYKTSARARDINKTSLYSR
jgi:hypothetical protein